MRRGGGRRDAGRNGYVWTCSTPEQRLFQYGSRAKAMLATILGEAFAGVLVSDFYGAYTSHEGLHQYCWAHLVRDIHDLTMQHPDDPAVQGWAVTMEALFARARAGATGSREARWAVRTEVQTAAKLVRAPGSAHDVPHRKLRVRILKHRESLFVFVTDPVVPPTNNAAERSLRPLVVARKISGGTRSATGTTTKLTLASLFGTWRAQGINPYLACRDLHFPATLNSYIRT